MKYRAFHHTPLGRIGLVEEDGALVNLCFGNDTVPDDAIPQETSLLSRATKQIDEYFAGTRREFDLPLRLEGTPFQLQVWEALCSIPHGETRSYGEIAAQIGKPLAARAVGGAIHRTPVALIVP